VGNQVIFKRHHFELLLRENRHQIVKLVIELKGENLLDILDANVKSLMLESEIIVELDRNQILRTELLD
jgi:hypothetical protein